MVISNSVIGSILLNVSAFLNNAFLTVSPGCNEGAVDDGGFANIDTMSSATCLKKSSTSTAKNGLLWGRM